MICVPKILPARKSAARRLLASSALRTRDLGLHIESQYSSRKQAAVIRMGAASSAGVPQVAVGGAVVELWGHEGAAGRPVT